MPVAKKILRERLKGLSPEERLVLSLRYGLDDNHCQSLDNIAKSLGLKRPHVKAIQLEAEQKLREGPIPFRRLQSE